MVASAGAGADTVTYETSKGITVTLTGEIVEFTGEQLVLRQPGGIDSAIPVDRIQSFDTAWLPDYQQAAGLRKSGKLAEALEKYRSALRSEKRRWAQRRILSEVVRLYTETGQHEQAAAMFLILLGDDPTTQYFDAIPLAWKAQQPSAALQLRAEGWMTAKDNSAAALIGASWLLPTAKRGSALTVLKRLAGDEDPRVAALAKAQVWQTEVVTATPETAARWESLVEEMPADVRAGPYLVLGRAWSHCGRHDQAALAMMRVPILYAAGKSLAAEALAEAAAELVILDRRDEALSLYREVVADHPDSEAAARARTRLAELGAEKGN